MNEDITISNGNVKAVGNVNIILVDGKTFTVTGEGGEAVGKAGINVSGEGNSLTIWGQANGTGIINATGGPSLADGGGGAGIGGDVNQNGNNITINGGTVNATGALNGAGIGGGCNKSGINITINGGTVIASGNGKSNGIGGSTNGSGSNITINGGSTTAIGGVYGNDGTSADGIGGFVSRSNIIVGYGLIVKAGNNNNPTDVVENENPGTTDLSTSLRYKKYVTVSPSNPHTWTYSVVGNSIKATCSHCSETATVELMGNSVVLVPTVAPANAANKAVSWSSDNTDVATVDANGKVKAGTTAGTATITATAQDGSGTKGTATIEVKAP